MHLLNQFINQDHGTQSRSSSDNMAVTNQGTQCNGSTKWMDEAGVVSLSARTALLLWPINFCHESKCKQNNCDSLKCKIFPIAPSANVRDVGDSRLYDKLRVDLIDGTCIDAMIGSIMNKDDKDAGPPPHCMFRMNSIFDRYADNNSNMYFTDDVDLDNLKEKAKQITTHIDDYKRNSEPADIEDPEDTIFNIKKFRKEVNKLKDYSSVLEKLLLHLNVFFRNFLSIGSYKILNEVLLTMDSDLAIPPCVMRGSLELQATFRFQKFMYPFCMVFLKGNHRHARLLLSMLGCHRAQSQELSDIPSVNANLLTHCVTFSGNNNEVVTWIDSAVNDGYMITERSTGLELVNPVETVINMKYTFFIPKKNKKLHDFTLDHFQSVCRKRNNILYHSVQEEAYHGIIQKCHDALSLMKESTGDMSSETKQVLLDFLMSSNSDKKNSTRKKDVDPSPYIKMRTAKQLQRQMIADTFFPQLQVSTSYVQGKTYIEKRYKKNKLKNIFEGETPHENSKLLQVFLLLDNIFIPDNIVSFIKMIRNTYNKMHLDSSIYHHISHAELWNSCTVLEDMNKFILETIKIMKNKGTMLEIRSSNYELLQLYDEDHSPGDSADEESIDEDVSDEDKPKKKKKKETDEMSLFHFKITHSCQQFAFFVALTIANMIGLYPIIPGCRLPDCTGEDQDAFSQFNVFRLLLDALLWKGDENLQNVRYIYVDLVVNDFISSLYYFDTQKNNRNETNNQNEMQITFPLTFQEFCDQNNHMNVIRFFHNTTTLYHEETKNFFSKNKKKKTQ